VTSTRSRGYDPDAEVEGEAEVVIGRFVGGSEGDPAADDPPITDAQRQWLARGLKSGATRETAALAAGIDDLAALMEADAGLAKFVAVLEARAEVALLEGMAESRPAFVLERTRPERYGPTVSRGLDPGENPDDDLFEERR
jgi:hypothetical protein